MKYPKMPSVFLRDPDTNYKKLLPWTWDRPEFEYLADLEWHFEEKIHGTNIRVTWDGITTDGVVARIQGRTDAAQVPAFLMQRLQEKFYNDEMWDAVFGPTRAILYGEGFGTKIQAGGGLYVPGGGVDFALFDIRVENGSGEWNWLDRAAVDEIAAKMDLLRAPALYAGYSLREVCSEFLAGVAPRMSLLGDNRAPMEGVVARPLHDLRTRGGDRVICKIKHEDIP